MKIKIEKVTEHVTEACYDVATDENKGGLVTMQERKRGNEYRATVICVDSYEGGIISGRFYNPCLGNGEGFHSMLELVFRIENMLDGMDFPQSYNVTRTFSKNAVQEANPVDENIQRGKLGTFTVRILFRQNASWQGSIVWQEGRAEQSFRSVLELLTLMNSALQE